MLLVCISAVGPAPPFLPTQYQAVKEGHFSSAHIRLLKSSNSLLPPDTWQNRDQLQSCELFYSKYLGKIVSLYSIIYTRPYWFDIPGSSVLGSVSQCWLALKVTFLCLCQMRVLTPTEQGPVA